MLLRSCVLVVLLALGGCDAPRSESAETRDEPEAPVAVVETASLEPAEIARKVEGVAAIINPVTLLQLDADLRSAVIASEFSKSQLNRADTLMKTSVAVSKQTYENAQRQSDSDITRLHLLESRLRQVRGDDAPFLTTESRRQLVGELSAGTRALVRIDFADSYGSAPRNIRIRRITAAFECGAIVNPDGLRNQVEGAIVQGIGGALFEALRFENGRITNPHFSQYRLPRFPDVPPIDLIILDRKDLPSAGAGETPIVGLAPAVAAGLFEATGERRRGLPLEVHRIGSS